MKVYERLTYLRKVIQSLLLKLLLDLPVNKHVSLVHCMLWIILGFRVQYHVRFIRDEEGELGLVAKIIDK